MPGDGRAIYGGPLSQDYVIKFISLTVLALIIRKAKNNY